MLLLFSKNTQTFKNPKKEKKIFLFTDVCDCSPSLTERTHEGDSKSLCVPLGLSQEECCSLTPDVGS